MQQQGLVLDDGSGLRVVDVRFAGETHFDWEFFRGYDTIRILTYSATIPAIVRMLDDFEFTQFECIIGAENTLRSLKDILAFQKVAVGDTRAAIMGLRDERHSFILKRVREGQARFRVIRKGIAHSKLYLLENSADGRKRVFVGSANLSEAAFSGRQSETLLKFDDDPDAWAHYLRMYNGIKDSASDEIPLPPERIVKAEIEIGEIPVIADQASVLVIEQTPEEDLQPYAPAQIGRIEKVAMAFPPPVNAAIPPFRNGKQSIDREVKREISHIRLVKSVSEADNRYLSINRTDRTVLLSGEQFPLEWDDDKVASDARLLLDYFDSYDGAFEGDVSRLQRDYFTLWAWLYFSPFICDLRLLALQRDQDVIRYPAFAIVFGKSNCGKTSLIDTLMVSMFGKSATVDKSHFTTARLRSLQQGYKRFPVVFDDIGRRPFAAHGRDIIKDEWQANNTEYPGFVLSMNAEPQSFQDEIVKRSLMIYTTTALPQHREELRQSLQNKLQEIRRGLTGHLYRRYLAEIMDALSVDRLPNDWLSVSSELLCGIISDAAPSAAPQWLRHLTWLEYAEKRYDRVKARLNDILRDSARQRNEGDAPNGWMLDGNRVIVWEQRDLFGRRGSDWEDVPSTLIDEDGSTGGRTVLNLTSLEGFLGRNLRPRPWWGRLFK